MKHILTCLITMVTFATSGPVFAQSKADIQSLDNTLASKFNTRNSTEASKMYADVALVSAPGPSWNAPGNSQHGPYYTRAEIDQHWATLLTKMGKFILTTDRIAVLQNGDIADIGSFTLTVAGNMPPDCSGQRAAIWRKDGSEWRMTEEMWSDSNGHDVCN